MPTLMLPTPVFIAETPMEGHSQNSAGENTMAHTLFRERFWFTFPFVSLLVTLCIPADGNAGQPGQSSETFGPRIIPIDYEALFQLDEAPSYKPFPMYGSFLFAVANQKLPMVYNTALALPDHIERISDVVYKESDGISLGLDIYFNRADESPNPLMFIIHGGYWKAGDKGQFHTQRATEFVNLGYTVASINYRLSTTHQYPANIEDLRDGILFLSAHADRFRIDPTRIVTYGISAGGHLAAFMALAANSDRPSASGLSSSSFKGAISLYGIHDLTLAVQREHPFTELYMGTPYDLDPGNYIEASTTSLVDENDPPILLIHGSIDGSVSVRNSDNLARALEAAGVPFVYDRIEGWPHVMDFFSPIGERSLWQTHRFLARYMPSDEMAGVEP
jgi:acetyl esterase/lipase